MVLLLGVWALALTQPQREVRNAALDKCRAQPQQLVVSRGPLRVAGPDYFWIDEAQRWRRFTHVCAGRTAAQCLRANEGVRRRLHDAVGQSVRVWSCGATPVAVELGQTRYALREGF